MAERATSAGTEHQGGDGATSGPTPRHRTRPAKASTGPSSPPADAAAPGTRDSQRAAVYAAEEQVSRILARAAEFPVVEVAGSHLTVPAERRFGDLASVQRYVDRLRELNWVRAAWPEAAARPVRVRARRGTARAHYEARPESPDAVIALPAGRDGVWALRELVVLHEFAHHLGGSTAGTADRGHGPAFAGRMLALVDGVIGPEAALLLRVALADQGVRPR